MLTRHNMSPALDSAFNVRFYRIYKGYVEKDIYEAVQVVRKGTMPVGRDSQVGCR